MIRRYVILSVFALQTLAGCSYLFPVRQHPEEIRAERLLQEGKHKEAVNIYRNLASFKTAQQNYYRLLTADALIRGNDVKQAKAVIAAQVNTSNLSDEEDALLHVLKAQIELSQGNAEQALAMLKNVQPELLKFQTRPGYYQSLAFAYSLTGNVIQSAQALINMEPFLYSNTAKIKNYQETLSTLSALSSEDLHLKQPLGNSVLSGWMALAKVLKSEPTSFDEQLAKWKKLYPGHPANSAFFNETIKNYDQVQTGLIAVFLPESGPFAGPASIIKKGFMKAHKLAQKQKTANREIRFYDTEKDSVSSLYRQAVKDGARLIVGPLDKKDIATLVKNNDLTVPVLALNHVEGLRSPKLYQFALTPIDDAEQVTLKAYKDGHQNALFLVPKTEQGNRFAGYFGSSWEKLGGKVVRVQGYDDSQTSFSALTRQISPQTADSIIINAYAKPAQFLYASLQKTELPVYATAQIYLGNENQDRDKKFEGVTFCDVPWMFPQAYAGELSKESLYESWNDLSPSYLRLFPMGIDAYQLIAELSHLKNNPYNGATGKLRLDHNNRVTRELFCARFTDGVPKALNFASESTGVGDAPPQQDSSAAKTDNNKTPLPELPNMD